MTHPIKLIYKHERALDSSDFIKAFRKPDRRVDIDRTNLFYLVRAARYAPVLERLINRWVKESIGTFKNC